MTKREFQGVLSLVCVLAVSGCGADKNQEDYRRSLQSAYNGQLSSVAGNYTGAIQSNIDGAPMGNVTLTIVNTPIVQTSADGLSTEQKSVGTGTISYDGLNSLAVKYTLGDYNPDNGNYVVNVTTADGRTLSLNGTISGGTFVGSISVDSYQNYGATVRLTKNAAAPNFKIGNLTSGARAKSLKAARGTYICSNWKDSYGSSYVVSLVLSNDDLSDDTTLANLFSPKQQIKAYFHSILLGANPNIGTDVGTEVFTSTLNEQNAKAYLVGTEISQVDGKAVVNKLQCSKGTDATGSPTLTCASTGPTGVKSFPSVFTLSDSGN